MPELPGDFMTTRRRLLCGMALFASAAALALPARADIRVGVVLSTTGPAAAISDFRLAGSGG